MDLRAEIPVRHERCRETTFREEDHPARLKALEADRPLHLAGPQLQFRAQADASVDVEGFEPAVDELRVDPKIEIPEDRTLEIEATATKLDLVGENIVRIVDEEPGVEVDAAPEPEREIPVRGAERETFRGRDHCRGALRDRGGGNQKDRSQCREPAARSMNSRHISCRVLMFADAHYAESGHGGPHRLRTV